MKPRQIISNIRRYMHDLQWDRHTSDDEPAVHESTPPQWDVPLIHATDITAHCATYTVTYLWIGGELLPQTPATLWARTTFDAAAQAFKNRILEEHLRPFRAVGGVLHRYAAVRVDGARGFVPMLAKAVADSSEKTTVPKLRHIMVMHAQMRSLSLIRPELAA